MKNACKRGFTLVELLVVVLIIGILSSVALPQYTKAVKKARGVQMVTAAKALADAMNMAYLEDGQYRRFFMRSTYSGNQGSSSDFDIEIPVPDHSWLGNFHFMADPYGNSALVSIRLYEQKNGGPYAELNYHLREGKINYIDCEGSACSSYFPGTILSSN